MMVIRNNYKLQTCICWAGWGICGICWGCCGCGAVKWIGKTIGWRMLSSPDLILEKITKIKSKNGKLIQLLVQRSSKNSNIQLFEILDLVKYYCENNPVLWIVVLFVTTYLASCPLSQKMAILSPVTRWNLGSVVKFTPNGRWMLRGWWSTTSSARRFSTTQFILDLNFRKIWSLLLETQIILVYNFIDHLLTFGSLRWEHQLIHRSPTAVATWIERCVLLHQNHRFLVNMNRRRWNCCLPNLQILVHHVREYRQLMNVIFLRRLVSCFCLLPTDWSWPMLAVALLEGGLPPENKLLELKNGIKGIISLFLNFLWKTPL